MTLEILLPIFIEAFSTFFITVNISLTLTQFLFPNKIVINKISKYDGLNCSDLNILNDSKSLEEIKREINKEKIKDILPYVEKIVNFTSENNLKNIYTNLNSLTIQKNRFILLKGIAGEYSQKENIITYALKSSIGHELLHLASRSIKNGKEYSGFIFKTKHLVLGRGLNEGYTELLASRLFNKSKKTNSYEEEVKIARILEYFFDNPKDMEKYYFNTDLPGLIHYMEKYAKREEIIKLITEIDKINNSSLDIVIALKTYYYIKIQLTLYKWFKEKNKDLDKLKKLEDLLCENKLVSLIINNEKTKLCYSSPYDFKENLHEEKRTR